MNQYPYMFYVHEENDSINMFVKAFKEFQSFVALNKFEFFFPCLNICICPSFKKYLDIFIEQNAKIFMHKWVRALKFYKFFPDFDNYPLFLCSFSYITLI